MFFKIPPTNKAGEPEIPPRIPNAREGLAPGSFKEEDRLLSSFTEEIKSTTTHICGNCHQPLRYGDQTCPHCKTPFSANQHTQMLSDKAVPTRPQNPFTGTAVSGEQKPITFEISGQAFNLPVSEVVTVGRMCQITDSMQPNVNLEPYQAFEKGVSRMHMKIIRKSILIYAVDLGSSNGTYLNGAKLTPHRERLLRSGDELQLGNLKLKVRF
jgi:hypothetical protein